MPEPEIKLDNLSKCLNESYLLFSNSHKNINFNINNYQGDLYFQFDKFQISQCFNNLIKNAVEAVEKIPNPSISINLKTDKNYIYIEIIDNGIGISKEKIGKIFEPYFTTKTKGTGLGLSIVKKIIEDHNGKIKIDKNKQMAGTTSLIIFENTNV
jgi:two-component system nitrogen regulation sensor histidine kinase NtrY